MPRLKFKSTSLFSLPTPVFEYEPGEMLILLGGTFVIVVLGMFVALVGSLLWQTLIFLAAPFTPAPPPQPRRLLVVKPQRRSERLARKAVH